MGPPGLTSLDTGVQTAQSAMAPSVQTVLTAVVVTALVAGAGALGVTWLARRKPTYAALAAPFVVVLSLSAGVSTAAATMLIAEDNRTVTFVLVAGAPLALAVGLVLARRVAAMEAAVVRAQAQSAATQAVEARRRELVTWMSHDLRTPMAGIRALAEAAAAGALDPREAADRIVREVDGMSVMVEDVFAMSSLQAEGGSIGDGLAREPVDLVDLVSDAVAALDPAARRQGVSLVGGSDLDGHTVLAAPSLLARAVTNLVDNAVRHTPAGGTVSVRVRGAGEFVEVTVRDGCAGLSQDALARAVEPGWREDATRGGHRGTGLGLAIANAVAQGHGGTLTLANADDGRGCIVTLRVLRPDDVGLTDS